MSGSDRGGIGLPDMVKYHKATHLNCVLEWCTTNSCNRWVQVQQAFMEFPLGGLACMAPDIPIYLYSHLVIGITLKLVNQDRKPVFFIQMHSSMTPVIGHPWFTPGLQEGIFLSHVHQGTCRLHNFRIESHTKPLSELKNMFDFLEICSSLESRATMPISLAIWQ